MGYCIIVARRTAVSGCQINPSVSIKYGHALRRWQLLYYYSNFLYYSHNYDIVLHVYLVHHDHLKVGGRVRDGGNDHYQLVLDTDVTEHVTLCHEHQPTQRGDDVIEGHVTVTEGGVSREVGTAQQCSYFADYNPVEQTILSPILWTSDVKSSRTSWPRGQNFVLGLGSALSICTRHALELFILVSWKWL